jgi:type I restriction enzyme S subunit
LGQVTVYAPVLSEQHRIAHVLDTADVVICRTAAVIAKLELLKKGLLNDLLTQGLDREGGLRPTRNEAPEQYNKTELGLVPKQWDIGSIGERIEFITDYRGKTPPYTTEGIPVISARCIGDGRIKEIFHYVTPEVYHRWTTRGFPKPDDVVFTTEAPVGEVALYPGDGVYLLTRRVFALRSDVSCLRKKFLYWQLLKAKRDRVWASAEHGSTAPRVLKPDVLNRVFAWPQVNEQDRIVGAMEALQTRFESQEVYLSKIKLIKQGLMHDLLTGRVLVPEGVGEEVASA